MISINTYDYQPLQLPNMATRKPILIFQCYGPNENYLLTGGYKLAWAETFRLPN